MIKAGELRLSGFVLVGLIHHNWFLNNLVS